MRSSIRRCSHQDGSHRNDSRVGPLSAAPFAERRTPIRDIADHAIRLYSRARSFSTSKRTGPLEPIYIIEKSKGPLLSSQPPDARASYRRHWTSSAAWRHSWFPNGRLARRFSICHLDDVSAAVAAHARAETPLATIMAHRICEDTQIPVGRTEWMFRRCHPSLARCVH
jgi:hypothetical protein